MTKYLLLIIVALGLSLGLFVNKAIKEADRADRMQVNYTEMNEKNKMLDLKYSELDDTRKAEVDSLSLLLDIKPKEVLKVVEIEVHDTIVDTVFVDLYRVNDTTFRFMEKINCFNIGGTLSIKDSIPTLILGNVNYNNNIKYVVYLDRKEWQIWFIKSKLFGRKEAELEVFPECGKATVEEVELINL